MNLKFLETFVWVARLKSFRLTAEKLFSTQASISSRIAVLEDELGVKLFVRDSRGVTLTPEGHKVLEYAEQMMDTMHALKQAIDTSAATQGRIRIGAMDTVIHTWLSPLVSKVNELYPAVEIELMADTARNLSEQLQKGYLDLIFGTDPLRHESVLNLELGSYPLCWIVSTGSIYHRDYASLAELARERVVTFSKHSRPHQDVLSLLHANGVAAPRLSCVNSVAAMTRLLRDGFGIGALPPALVSQELERGELTILRIGPMPPSLPLVMSWRGGTGLELVEQVVNVSKSVVAHYAENVGKAHFVPAELKKGEGRLRPL
ncbi:LysR family transcriptional regulator [Pseudomonas sp. CR3202]|uniref:LysR family transcriptional regulator n=1 Tax=Pseudomonas sp. CR3202 TaxID=3351532 RepID=UPI003BEF569F